MSAGALIWMIALSALSLGVEASESRTYYVRTDGGTAAQCSGQVDAPYVPGVSRDRCAWNNPMIALPSNGDGPGSTRLAPGDTLDIAPGEYQIGFGVPGAERCYSSATYACTMGSPPSGRSAEQPTRIRGRLQDGKCVNKPVLWGSGGVMPVVVVRQARDVVIECLEVTDHEGCVNNGNHPMACARPEGKPWGPWASVGLWAEDAERLILRDLDIHGLAGSGVVAGRMKDLRVTRVRIAANPMVGWDGDLWGQSKNSGYTGNNVFEELVLEWNGCAEGYPDKKPKGCFGQSAGGYGDGMGLAHTGGDFVIRDSIVRFNTSDGLDLLYHRAGGSILIERVHAEGNAGNQIKAAGSVTVRNSVILGNCGFFKDKPFTHHVDHCRAAGDALAVGNERAGEEAVIVNNTIVSAGNVTVLLSGPPDSRVTMRNNIVVGLPAFISPGDQSADVYCYNTSSECKPWPTVDRQFDTVINVRSQRSYCRNPGMRCLSNVPPPYGLGRADVNGIDARLPPGSIHRDAGTAHPAAGTLDAARRARVVGSAIDRGALEAAPPR
ncbi:MAG: right-handed parallel beta-helix repeat-containing protein [Rubrivivax sp.]